MSNAIRLVQKLENAMAILAFWAGGMLTFRLSYGSWPPMSGRFLDWLAGTHSAIWSIAGGMVVGAICSTGVHLTIRRLCAAGNEEDLLFREGIMSHNRGETQKAIEAFDHALKLCKQREGPDAARIYASLGKVYFDLGEMRKADENAEHALRIYSLHSPRSEALVHVRALRALIRERADIGNTVTQFRDPQFGFSFDIPAGWVRQQLVDELRRGGGRVAVSHSSHAATLNVSAGMLDRPEWRIKEVRASSAEDLLQKIPDRAGGITVDTSIPFAGEENVVNAEYETQHEIRGRLRSRRNGFLSIVHSGIEYVVQWSAEAHLEGDARQILGSFKLSGKRASE
jgi:tetratricopeptide (TPR) repeat protein